jgi:SAM-dependent methyltransferase
MTEATHYVIRGGIQGRERLRILARVMQPTSAALFDRLGLRDGLRCLDVGCGGGDVTVELSRRVAPTGMVIGTDMDGTEIEVARREAQQGGTANVEFRVGDVRELSGTPEFDLVYARFLLTHLDDPAAALRAFYTLVRPGGMIAVEDIDFSGYFTYPESDAFRRYCDWYCAVVRRRGCDPNIGPRLPLLLEQCGFEAVGVSAVQPIGTRGEVKLINPITMENIADVVVEEGFATRDETRAVAQELYEFAADHNTVAGVPRIVQAWGRRPAA